jgi:hypothetical protein
MMMVWPGPRGVGARIAKARALLASHSEAGNCGDGEGTGRGSFSRGVEACGRGDALLGCSDGSTARRTGNLIVEQSPRAASRWRLHGSTRTVPGRGTHACRSGRLHCPGKSQSMRCRGYVGHPTTCSKGREGRRGFTSTPTWQRRTGSAQAQGRQSSAAVSHHGEPDEATHLSERPLLSPARRPFAASLLVRVAFDRLERAAAGALDDPDV